MTDNSINLTQDFWYIYINGVKKNSDEMGASMKKHDALSVQVLFK
jgi:hypothetical protein